MLVSETSIAAFMAEKNLTQEVTLNLATTMKEYKYNLQVAQEWDVMQREVSFTRHISTLLFEPFHLKG